jgi:uncharacterized protein (TIGR02569 family)
MIKIQQTVLNAFNVKAEVEALQGGQGESFRAGDIVLKPAPLEAEWLAETFKGLKETGFRIPRPVSTSDGKWVFDKWCAWTFIPGHHDIGRVREIILTAKAFHASLAGFSKPDFLDKRKDPWAVADRMAWGEVKLDCHPALREPINKLSVLLKPLDFPSQLIHGDLIGNVLFEEGIAPGVIDFSLYWRPSNYAIAIIVVDAMNWHGVYESILQYVGGVPGFYQLMIRAQIFRLAVLEGFRQQGADISGGIEDQESTVELICGRLKEQYY